MKTALQQANAFRIKESLPAGEPAVATFARGLIDRNNNVILSGEEINAGEDPIIGVPNVIEADQNITIGSNAQAIIYGPFTIQGKMTIAGEVRFGPWPF